MLVSEKNKRVISFLTDRRYRILRHITLISAFVTLHQCARVLIIIKTDQFYSGDYSMYISLMPLLVFSSVLYINIYLLMPLFFKGRYLQYLGLVIITIMGGLFLMNWISDSCFEPYRIAKDVHKVDSIKEYAASTIFIIPIVLATSAARLMQRWIRNMERYRELDKLTVDMELAALKNQINPHFLFNMLNNVNVLVKKNPEKASAIILKLSDFLRYQLYGNNAKTTSLMAETEFLYNFLNLEKIRRDNFTFSITCETPGSSSANVLIPPNIFTTFVENA